MSVLVTGCPRCGATKITFDLLSSHRRGEKYGWQSWHDAFCLCRNCHQTVVFVLSQISCDDGDQIRQGLERISESLNNYFKVECFVSLKDFVQRKPPEHVPAEIKAAFEEGATCMAVQCFNAGATMFRLCIDHSTRSLLPPTDVEGLNSKIRWSLGLRLKWLFDTKRLPEALRDLSECVKEDGNDGAHAGTLTEEEAEDLVDFASVLLERLYTEPERLRLAQERRDARRSPKST